MKKAVLAMLALAVTLTGCVGLAPAGPETISNGEKTYKTGFYGDLFPKNYEFDGQSFTVNNKTLKKIKHDDFSLYHADIGSSVNGTIYCAEEDYEQAAAFYSDPQNYSYFCILGPNKQTQSRKTRALQNMDDEKFEELSEFAKQSGYDPFDAAHNAKIETVELPMPGYHKYMPIVFYKESTDHLFVSSKAADYYIFDDQLYMVYQYDYGHGEYEKLIAVKVPEALSTYFVEYIKPYLEKEQSK